MKEQEIDKKVQSYAQLFEDALRRKNFSNPDLKTKRYENRVLVFLIQKVNNRIAVFEW